MSGHVRIAVQLWISFIATTCALAGQGEQFTAQGVVLGPDGEPVSGAIVSLYLTYDNDRLHVRFTMTWVKWYDKQYRSDDKAYELIALDLKRGRACALKMQEEMEGLRLGLKPAVTITGTVVDSEGKPIERAIVSPMLRGDDWGMNLSANKRFLTDRSGRFAVSCVLPDRTCEINIHTNGHEQVKKVTRTPADTEKPFDVGRIELVSEADTEY